MVRNSFLSFAKITGTGVYIPEKILSNKDLESMVDTSDEWIKTRTGISERRILDKDKTTSDNIKKPGISLVFSTKRILPKTL